jgi:hypothetical protein
MSSWVVLCNYLLVLVVIAHFVWYYLHGGSGVPTIKDGQYVLDSRGANLEGAYSGGVSILLCKRPGFVFGDGVPGKGAMECTLGVRHEVKGVVAVR